MDSYGDISDEVLIGRVRDGHPEIMDIILERYKNLVRKRANAMFLIGGENEDLIQEGMIGLFKAIRDFQEDRGVSFTILRICVFPARSFTQWRLPGERSTSL